MAKSGKTAAKSAESYLHTGQTASMRPDVGTEAQFRKKKPPKTYRYDSSLSPALAWDAANGAREAGEWLLGLIDRASLLDARHNFPTPEECRSPDGRIVLTIRGLRDAVEQLKRLSKPFLDWAGKAERLSFDVPTLPLFVHERLSTKAIVETLVGHRTDKQIDLYDLFGDPKHSIADQTLRAYEYQDKWVNRLVLGDALVVMSSLLQYEGLGGQVQMIYIDPPYGVKFGSNFQPFVRKRDVSHGDDEDLTREPEMVKAYRDTWELGLHSYPTYMRDRLLLARDLLAPSGSVFVQISDENLHHVRELIDEVFGSENALPTIVFRKTTGAGSPTGYVEAVPQTVDYLLWACRDRARAKLKRVFLAKDASEDPNFNWVEDKRTGARRQLTSEEDSKQLSPELRLFQANPITSQSGGPTTQFPVELDGKTYSVKAGGWKTNAIGMERLRRAERLIGIGNTLRYVRYSDDFPFVPVIDVWDDTRQSGFAEAKLYQLKDEKRGSAGGFVYVRKQNTKGEEAGGIVPHVTLKSIANNEPPDEEVLVDRPEADNKIVRVTGPFSFEATIPTPVDWEDDGVEDSGSEAAQTYASFVDRMIEVLRRSPVLHVGGGRTVQLTNVRQPTKSLSLSAEAMSLNGDVRLKPDTTDGTGNGDPKSVAFVFGPENDAISERLVHSALQEANLKGYAHLYVVGFAIQPNARQLIEGSSEMGLLPATYVQATPDLMMGDLLKNMRSSQIFSVCGLPELKVHHAAPEKKGEPPRFQIELVGLDTFDPSTMENDHRAGADVPAWFIDTDYNGLSFHVSQAFFPRTGAWNDLRKALKGDYDDSAWDHLAGTISAPFEADEHKQIAVKVIDDRGNELLVVKPLA